MIILIFFVIIKQNHHKYNVQYLNQYYFRLGNLSVDYHQYSFMVTLTI